MVDIVEVTTLNDEIFQAFERLIPQLSPAMQPPTREQMAEILASPAVTQFAARNEEGQIVGLLSLVLFRTPAGKSGLIEDVVVDSAARGQGIGETLVLRALEAAREQGAKKVDLTSAPWREAANHLYQRIGFVRWGTNFYRYPIEP